MERDVFAREEQARHRGQQVTSLGAAAPMTEPLRKTADFQRLREAGLFRRGVYCAISAAAHNVIGRPATGKARVGIITSKRIGGAVQRNRARRLLREAMRTLDESLGTGWDLVLIAQPAICAQGVRMQQVRDDVRSLLRRAGVIAVGRPAQSGQVPEK